MVVILAGTIFVGKSALAQFKISSYVTKNNQVIEQREVTVDTKFQANLRAKLMGKRFFVVKKVVEAMLTSGQTTYPLCDHITGAEGEEDSVPLICLILQSGAAQYVGEVFITDLVTNETSPIVRVVITSDEPPTVAIVSPGGQTNVCGLFTLQATAMDDVGVSNVDFYIDGLLVGTDFTSPYSFDWDSTTVPDGIHEVKAEAEDSSGQTTFSDPLLFSVSNPCLN